MFTICIFSWNPFVILKQNLAFIPEECFEEPTTFCTPKMKHIMSHWPKQSVWLTTTPLAINFYDLMYSISGCPGKAPWIWRFAYQAPSLCYLCNPFLGVWPLREDHGKGWPMQLAWPIGENIPFSKMSSLHLNLVKIRVFWILFHTTNVLPGSIVIM